MRFRICLSIHFLTGAMFATLAQSDISTDTITDKLTRTWYLDWQNSQDTLRFLSTSLAPMGWGQRIEIHKNGDFADAYSSKCGNSGIYYKKGQWSLDLETLVLKTSIPINGRATKYKIEKLDTTQLILTERSPVHKSH